MSKIKFISLALSLATLAGASIAIFFGVNTNTNQEENKSLPKQFKKTTKEIIQKQPLKTYQSLGQTGDLNQEYYKFEGINEETIGKHNTNYYISKMDELLAKKENVNSSDLLIMPSFLYEMQKSDWVQPVRYEGRNYWETDYQLSNSLNMVINPDAKDRRVVSSFINFIKRTSLGRAYTYQILDNLDDYQNNIDRLSPMCFDYSNMQNSDSSLKQMIGNIYATIGCNDKYGFSNLNFGDFLSSFVELNKRKAIVSFWKTGIDRATGYEYVTKDFAINHSLVEYPYEGQIIDIYDDVVSFVENLDIKSVSSFASIFKTLKSKVLTQEGPVDPLKVVQKIVEENPKFDDKSANTLLAIMLGVLGKVNSLHNEAIQKYDFESSIKQGDLAKTLIDKTGEGLENLIKKILFGDENVISYFMNKVTKRNNPDNLASYKVVQQKFQKELDEVQKEIPEIENQIKEIDAIFDPLNYELGALMSRLLDLQSLPEFQEASEIKNQISKLEEEKRSLQEDVESLKLVISIKENTLSLLLESSSNDESIKSLQYELESFGNSKLTKEARIEEIDLSLKEKNDRLKEIESMPEYQEIERLDNERATKRQTLYSLYYQKQDLKKRIKTINDGNQFLINKIAALDMWEKEKTFKEKIAGIKAFSLFETMSFFVSILKEVVLDALDTLGIIEFGDNGAITFNSLEFNSISDIMKFRPFFSEKGAIETLNKAIGFMNSVASQFTQNSVTATTKFLFNSFPDAMLKLLDTKINLFGIEINIKEGVDLKQKDLYGLIVGTGGFIGGTTLGTAIGCMIGKEVGCFVGGIIGAVLGTSISGGLAYYFINDGNLKIDKLNDKVLAALDELREKKKKGEKIAFNLFTDGHTLLKENYIPELNVVFKDLAKLFLFSEPDMKKKVDDLDTKYSNKEFKGWEMVGEVMKTMMVAPDFWKDIIELSSYEKNSFQYRVFKEDLVDQIRTRLNYDKSLISYFAKTTNEDEYIDDLYNLQKDIANWLIDTIFITKATEFVKGQHPNIRIGYKSNIVSLETLNLWEKEFKRFTNYQGNIIFNQYAGVVDNQDDAFLTYTKINSEIIRFNQKSIAEIEELELQATDERLLIPLYKTTYVVVKSIYLTDLTEIDQAKLEDLYTTI